MIIGALVGNFAAVIIAIMLVTGLIGNRIFDGASNTIKDYKKCKRNDTVIFSESDSLADRYNNK